MLSPIHRSSFRLSTGLGLLFVLLGCSKKSDATNQCVDSVLSNNVTDPDLLVLQPNGISPNGDGRNDRFVVVVRSKNNPQNAPVFTSRRLQVTRLGSAAVVYDNPSYNNDFDGHDAAGQELPEGNYRYELTLDQYVLMGSVKVVRTSKACSCRTLDLNDPYLESTVCQ